jgi:hypothetical protein
MRLSKEVNRHKRNRENILTYVEKNGILKIPQYCSNAGFPLCVVWYLIQENFDEYREEASSELERICKFYNIIIDLERTGDVVEADE